MPTLRDKFRACLLGAAIGDIAGAPVEAESPGYIAKMYTSIDDVLSVQSIPELLGPEWQVGRFTDDMQMTLCVAEWLLADEAPSPQPLLARFAQAYERWRRYGPGTEAILRLYERHPDQWRTLSTAFFPEGSYGNGSAMRVSPIGLAYHDDPSAAASVAIESSRPTHSHSLAYQGAVLQTVAVATAVTTDVLDPAEFLRALRTSLVRFSDLMQDTSMFNRALNEIEQGLIRRASCMEMSDALGTGVAAHEAVPMAIYCALRHPQSFRDAVHQAVFIGGDTDTIASMTGAISGAALGRGSIPVAWVQAVREDQYGPAFIESLADRLYATSVP